MEFLEWLEVSPVGNWVAGSLWGYPISLGAHAFGMAILAGVALMFSLRVMGVAATGVPVNTLPKYMKVAQFGFVVNLISGLGLFCGSAVTQWGSWPFRIKIILIFIGLWLTTWVYKNCLMGDGTISQKHKTYAALALLAWLGALIAGRLIAYVDLGY